MGIVAGVGCCELFRLKRELFDVELKENMDPVGAEPDGFMPLPPSDGCCCS